MRRIILAAACAAALLTAPAGSAADVGANDDTGKFSADGGAVFFAQMAAMHACGPYKIDAINVDSYLNYTNNQPSSSIRAPKAN